MTGIPGGDRVSVWYRTEDRRGTGQGSVHEEKTGDGQDRNWHIVHEERIGWGQEDRKTRCRIWSSS